MESVKFVLFEFSPDLGYKLAENMLLLFSEKNKHKTDKFVASWPISWTAIPVAKGWTPGHKRSRTIFLFF